MADTSNRLPSYPLIHPAAAPRRQHCTHSTLLVYWSPNRSPPRPLPTPPAPSDPNPRPAPTQGRVYARPSLATPADCCGLRTSLLALVPTPLGSARPLATPHPWAGPSLCPSSFGEAPRYSSEMSLVKSIAWLSSPRSLRDVTSCSGAENSLCTRTENGARQRKRASLSRTGRLCCACGGSC